MQTIKHKIIETNVTIMTVLILVTVSIGGIVELVPLFTIESTIEEVDGVRPYSPLERAGRNVDIKEGGYTCPAQMVRPYRDEVERYGHYSIAAESMYDHPFQWGSKRTGPDLARVGGKYSNDWQVLHLTDPRSVVPESIMPAYPWLLENDLDPEEITGHLKALSIVGVPYSDEMIAAAAQDMMDQADPDGDWDAVQERYPGAIVGDFDGDPTRLTEMDALVAYLQMLGTLVDFSQYDAEALRQ
jgi:cytochrome c oxidase cbb3-type subunit 2